MKKVKSASDQNGYDMQVGDLVMTLSDNVTQKVQDICEDLGTRFVRLRPAHQSRGKGIWHAAEHVLRIGSAR